MADSEATKEKGGKNINTNVRKSWMMGGNNRSYGGYKHKLPRITHKFWIGLIGRIGLIGGWQEGERR